MTSPSSLAVITPQRAPAKAGQTAEPPSSPSKQPHKPPTPRPTHFLCLPLVTPTSRPQLASSISLLRDALPPSIPQKALRSLGTLHLTIGVCHLRGKAEVERARWALEEEVDVLELLRKAEEQNAGAVMHRGEEVKSNPPPPLTVDLTSLHPMHSPKSTSVLFAAPHDPTDRLQRFSENLRDAFIEKGVLLPQLETVKVEVKEEEGEEDSETGTTPDKDRRTRDVKMEKVERERDLKLHATLVNGVYALERKKKGKGGGKGGGPAPSSISPSSAQSLHPESSTISPPQTTTSAPSSPTPPPSQPSSSLPPTSSSLPRFSSKGRFDATSLLSRFADQVWARDVHIEAIELCEMGAKKVLDEESGKVVDEVYKVVARRQLPWEV